MPLPFAAQLVRAVGGFSAAAVTPSDGTVFAPSAIYVGGAGAVAVMPADGVGPVTFSGVAAGTVLPVLVTQVYATGTTATLMVRLP
jgi:hypothetical protein